VVAWSPGTVEDKERYFLQFRRLNQRLDTANWRVYKRKPNGDRLVLSIDRASVAVLENLKWRPFSGVGLARFSLLGAKPEGKK